MFPRSCQTAADALRSLGCSQLSSVCSVLPNKSFSVATPSSGFRSENSPLSSLTRCGQRAPGCGTAPTLLIVSRSLDRNTSDREQQKRSMQNRKDGGGPASGISVRTGNSCWHRTDFNPVCSADRAGPKHGPRAPRRHLTTTVFVNFLFNNV